MKYEIPPPPNRSGIPFIVDVNKKNNTIDVFATIQGNPKAIGEKVFSIRGFEKLFIGKKSKYDRPGFENLKGNCLLVHLGKLNYVLINMVVYSSRKDSRILFTQCRVCDTLPVRH